MYNSARIYTAGIENPVLQYLFCFKNVVPNVGENCYCIRLGKWNMLNLLYV